MDHSVEGSVYNQQISFGQVRSFSLHLGSLSSTLSMGILPCCSGNIHVHVKGGKLRSKRVFLNMVILQNQLQFLYKDNSVIYHLLLYVVAITAKKCRISNYFAALSTISVQRFSPKALDWVHSESPLSLFLENGCC